jgi:hypothetical protein
MIIIFFLLILFFLVNKENFNPVNENTPKSFIDIDYFYRILFPTNINTTSIYENRFNFIPITINEKKLNDDISNFNKNYQELKSNKCCLVKKILNKDEFKYTYKEYFNSDCDLNNFELDQNNQLLFDGQNGWSNSQCSNNTSKLGSCQHYNFECIDFVSKNKCDEYNNRIPPDPQKRKITFNWNQKPCYNR